MTSGPQFDDSRYEALGEVARGGMGVIYKVHDCELDRTLAMKRMLSAPDVDGDEVEVDRFARFMEEAHVTAQLDHPGIVPVYDLGTDEDGCAWYTMKMVRGRELGEVIELARSEKESWNLPRLVGVLVRVCQAVAYAHAKGVIHRDLKPANIMVGDLGEVYVMDWGLARQLGRDDVRDIRLKIGDALAGSGIETIASPRSADASSKSSLDAPLMTMDGAVIGTPAYMPPEQAAGIVDQVDHLSDIYSLGAILYEVLAEAPPYQDTGASVAKDVITALSNGPPTPVRQLRANAPAELAAICEKAMSRAREDRYRTTLELAEDLQAFLDGRVVRAHQTGAVAEFKKWVLRNKATAAAAAGVVVSLVALVLLQTFSKNKISDALDREKAALQDTQLVLADSYVTFGLEEAQKLEFARAKLWFTEAAKLSESDPARLRANQMRAYSSGQLAPQLLRIMKLPESQLQFVEAHPSGPLVVVHGRSDDEHLVVDVDRALILPLSNQLGNPSAYLGGVAFDPGGTRIAVSPEPGQVSIRQLPDGKLIEALDFGDAEIGVIHRMSWSDDGTLLFLGAPNGRIYDLERQKLWPAILAHEYTNTKVHERTIQSCRFSPEGNYLATVGRFPDWTMKVFGLDCEAQSASLLWESLQSAGSPPDFLGNGRWLRTSSEEGISIHEMETGRQIVSFHSGEPPENGLPAPLAEELARRPALWHFLNPKWALYPDRFQRAASHLPSLTLSLEDSVEQPYPASIWQIRGFLQSGADPLAISRQENFLHVWRLTEDRRLWTVPSAPGSAPVFDSSGRFVAAAGEKQTEFQVHDLRERTSAGPKLAPGGVVRAAAFSPSDEPEVVLALHGEARLERWNWRTGERLAEPIALPSPPLAVLWSPDGEWLAAAAESGDVFRVDVRTGEARHLFQTPSKRPLDTLRFVDHADGALLIATHDGNIQRLNHTCVWDLEAARFKFPPLEHGSHGFHKTMDYRDGILITANGPHTFCDIATGAPIPSPATANLGHNTILFGPDPTTILTSGRTAAARVLHLHTGENLAPDLVHGFNDHRWVHRTLHIPGTPWIAIAGMNGVRFFDINSAQPVAPPVQWPESKHLWLFPQVKISSDRRTLASNLGGEGLRLVDLSLLLEQPDPTPDPKLDEIDAGARLVRGGLTEMTWFKERPEKWWAWREKNPDHPRLLLR
ncbi:MAG: WD40 repeat protein [Verrucomicrobiales bacterium]